LIELFILTFTQKLSRQRNDEGAIKSVFIIQNKLSRQKFLRSKNFCLDWTPKIQALRPKFILDE
jgi:hypothetical protein